MLRDPRASALVTSFASAVARHAKGADVPAGLRTSSRSSTRTFAARFQRRRRCSSRARSRADRSIVDLITRRLFLRQRAAGASTTALRGINGERFRRVTFTDGVRGGLLGQGSRADGDVVSRSHGAGGARILGARESARHAAAAAAAGRARSEGRHRDGRPLSMREQMEKHRREPGVRGVSRAHGSARLLAGELRRHRPLARTAATACPSTRRRRVRRRHADRRRARAARASSLKHRDSYVHTFVAKLLTYALGRHLDYRDQPGGPPDRPRCRAHRDIAGRLSFSVS